MFQQNHHFGQEQNLSLNKSLMFIQVHMQMVGLQNGISSMVVVGKL
jgi:hypothetical protein